MNCKNCNKELSGQEKFCSNCGQKNIDKLSLKFILSSFIDDFFNVDSKVVLTLKHLVLKPGLLSKEYMEGKRASYVPPIRLYLVLSVIYFFLVSVIDVKTVENSGESPIEITNQESSFSFSNADTTVFDSVTASPTSTISFNGAEADSLISLEDAKELELNGTLDHYLDSVTKNQGFAGYLQKQTVKANVRKESFWENVRNQVSLFLLLFIPLLALVYATCFSRNKYGYVGHLVFNLHFNSFVILLLSISQLIGGIGILNSTLDLIWFLLLIIGPQIYLIRSIMIFYERKWWNALYKYFLLIIGYFSLCILFFVVVAAASILMT